MKKIYGIMATMVAEMLLMTLPANAMCPVCVVAVGAGVGLSRWVGITDLVTGVWIGGFLMSITMWTIDWLHRKKIKVIFPKILSFLFWYGFTIIPLYAGEMIGHPNNQFLGIDKLLFGIIAGTIVFYAAAKYYLRMKHKNGGKPHFRFEKIAMTVGGLLLTSLMLWLIGR